MFPKILELGPVTLHTYGLLLATAYLVSISLASRLARREGILGNRIWDMGFVIILSAILGAKLLLVLTDLGSYLEQPTRFFSTAA